MNDEQRDPQNQKIFEDACRSKNTTQLEKLINSGCFDVNEPLSSNWIKGVLPLFYALWTVDPDKTIVKFLLEKGADVNKEYIGCSPLLFSVQRRDLEAVKILLEHSASTIMINKSNSQTTFKFSIDEYIKSQRDPIENRDPDNKIIEILKIIALYGAKLCCDCDNTCYYQKYYTLCTAIFNNDLASINDILNENFDYSIKNEYHPSIIATRFFMNDVVELFLQKKINSTEIWFTSIEINSIKIMEMCIHHGVDLKTVNSLGQNGLHIACLFKQDEAIRFFKVECGLDPNVMDNKGLAPLHLCFISNLKDKGKIYKVFDSILNFGIPVNSNVFDDIMHRKYSWLNCDIVTLFLEHFFKMDDNFQENCSPYHYCDHESCSLNEYYNKLILIDPEFVEQFDKNLNVQEKCKNELERMKKFKISNCTMSVSSKSLYDFIFFTPNMTSRYSKNQNLIQLYEENNKDYRNQYANYGFVLNYQYRRGMRRIKLLETAQRVLEFALGYGITDEIRDSIFQYFSDETLRRIGDE